MRSVSFRVRFLVSALLPLMAGMGLMYILLNQTLSDQFQDFQLQRGQELARSLKDLLLNYYQNTGSWQGIDNLFHAPDPSVLQRTLGDRTFLLADDRGRVLSSSESQLIGMRISGTGLADGVSIDVDGQSVGTFVIGPVLDNFSPTEERFLLNRSQAVLWIGGIAALLGVLLVTVFYHDLRAYTHRMAHAARAIASGQLDHRLKIQTQDAFGQLALTFNEMALKLDRAQKLRSNMIADIAHELRTPLAVIRADLEALLNDVLPASKETLSAMYDRSLLLSRLIDDLMTMHLAEVGELRLHCQPTDLNELVEGVATYVKPSLLRKSMDLQLVLTTDLPRPTIDPERIEQVLLNLLSNAVHYTSDGETILVGTAVSDRHIRFWVSDTGPGIAPNDLPHVFERFYRLHPAAEHDGAGLGLAIARRLVETHGGHLDVESALGYGTTFTAVLPLT